jgi:DNA-binding NarL/FixJ family response regulator
MRIVIVDDSVIVREGLRQMLALGGHDVVAALATPDTLPATVSASEPDAVVLDIRMPPTHTDEGLRAATQLRDSFPELGILVLSQYVVPEYAMRLLESGAPFTGYLLKDRILEPQELSVALSRVMAGGTVVDPELVTSLLKTRHQKQPLTALTPRELEVLELMARGLTDKGIAQTLFLTPNTVSTHVGRIFTKLDLPGGATENRRVLAVLGYLNGTGNAKGS